MNGERRMRLAQIQTDLEQIRREERKDRTLAAKENVKQLDDAITSIQEIISHG